MTLDELRLEIDDIDNQLFALFARRMSVSDNIARTKIKEGVGVLNTGREKKVLENAKASVPEEYSQYAVSLAESIMELSRSRQHELIAQEKENGKNFTDALKILHSGVKSPRVAVQGVPGSYAGIAAKKMHGQQNLNFFETWEDVFRAVDDGCADYGVLPVENSTAGSVSDVFDLLLKYRFYINRACQLSVNHCLLGIHGATPDTVKNVYSHPQALAQCRDFIKERGYDKTTCLNTAAAAKMVAESGDVTKAAIASYQCAENYGLEIIFSAIQQEKDNRTRFISISKNPEILSGADKISLVFALPHETGSLYRMLARFAHSGHNLTKIESRPVPKRPFEYYFYVDFFGSIGSKKTAALLGDLQKELPFFHFLGNYTETEV